MQIVETPTPSPARVFPSRVELSDAARARLGEYLNTTLASLVDLHSQVKQAHWNIKGPWFFARHELFDKLGTNLLAFADEIAERASTLGNATTGTAYHATMMSVLPQYPIAITDGKAHLTALADRYATLAAHLREGVALARELDVATDDLVVSGLRQTELDLWFLESHLHD